MSESEAYFLLLFLEQNDQIETEERGEVIEENADMEQDIYSAQGYVALSMEEPEKTGDETDSYFDSGYMTLPDEDPDADKTSILFPSNYEEIASCSSELE